jgi:hypothetical protein
MRWLTKPSPRIADLFRHWVHEVNMGTPHVLPIVSEVALGDFVPTRESVRAVGGWKASLRDRVPLAPGNRREIVVDAKLLACSSRGPFALGPLRSTTFDRPVLFGSCPAPKGETVTLIVLRDCSILDGRPVGIRIGWVAQGDMLADENGEGSHVGESQIVLRCVNGRATADCPAESNPFALTFSTAAKTIRIAVDGAFAVASVRFEITELGKPPLASKPAASPNKQPAAAAPGRAS